MDTHAIAQVQPGMTVIDRERKEIGEVAVVKLGDPEALTTEGQDMTSDAEDLWGRAVRTAFGSEHNLPDELADRLMRTGYLKVDARGFLQPDLFVGADQVAQVSDETVYLSVSKAELARKA